MNNARVGKLIFTIAAGNLLGEGVQWDVQNQAIWWTDIENSCLFRYCVNSAQLSTQPMPDRVGCFGFIVPALHNTPTNIQPSEQRLIVAFAAGIALLNLATTEIEWLAQPEKHIAGNRFNDGRVDRQGRFWAGTMVENASNSNEMAALYRIGHDRRCEKIISELEISNGLCWSTDGLTMYHSDSPKGKIYRYDFEPKLGNVSNKRLFATCQAGCFPDGSTVDVQGYVWNAQWGGSKVVRYNSNGDVDLVLTLPVSQPSCVAIGGPNMDWLIVTSATQGLSAAQLKKQPLAGHLFIYQLHGISGLPESRYI